MSAASLLLELSRRYAEPHRHYHSIEHIAAMLHQGRELALDDGQVLAVWFHDAVYDARRGDNEEESALLAERMLRAEGLGAAEIARVCAIVRDTKLHRPSSPDAAPVLDLDLAGLALPWPEFTRNTERIRKEYAHVDDASFAAGRAAFFRAMLARDRLYWTPWGARLEPLARANLARAVG